MKSTSLLKHCIIICFISIHLNVKAQSDQQTAFQVTVTGQGQPMILIPGATCSGAVWDEMVARYKKKYQCHVITLAGYAGVAPISNPPYLETFETDLIKYFQDHKLNHVILVGHSIGGFIALSIAASADPRLEKVILVDALPFLAEVMSPGAGKGFNEVQAKFLLDGYNKMNDVQLKGAQFQVAKSLCADSSKWDRISAWGAASDRKTKAYSMTEMLGRDLRQQISTVKVPVLVMAAFKPVAAYPQFTKENVLATYQGQYAACKPCLVKVTSSSKHFIMYDEPAWFYKETDSFLDLK
jgi:N-formylmaleamate deformylase